MSRPQVSVLKRPSSSVASSNARPHLSQRRYFNYFSRSTHVLAKKEFFSKKFDANKTCTKGKFSDSSIPHKYKSTGPNLYVLVNHSLGTSK